MPIGFENPSAFGGMTTRTALSSTPRSLRLEETLSKGEVLRLFPKHQEGSWHMSRDLLIGYREFQIARMLCIVIQRNVRGTGILTRLRRYLTSAVVVFLPVD
jgi:hypothetical protein